MIKESGIVERLVRIADASRRADGSDIPLGEQCREAATLIAELQAADRDHLSATRGMEKRLNDEIEKLRASLHRVRETAWQPIETAPRDGTRILIWFVHAHAKYSDDPVAEGWEAAHEAYWIDHNGGGWTWHGLCGVATYWQLLPAPPAVADTNADAPGNVGLVSGVSADPISKTGEIDSGAAKTAESSHSPSTREG